AQPAVLARSAGGGQLRRGGAGPASEITAEGGGVGYGHGMLVGRRTGIPACPAGRRTGRGALPTFILAPVGPGSPGHQVRSRPATARRRRLAADPAPTGSLLVIVSATARDSAPKGTSPSSNRCRHGCAAARPAPDRATAARSSPLAHR